MRPRAPLPSPAMSSTPSPTENVESVTPADPSDLLDVYKTVLGVTHTPPNLAWVRTAGATVAVPRKLVYMNPLNGEEELFYVSRFQGQSADTSRSFLPAEDVIPSSRVSREPCELPSGMAEPVLHRGPGNPATAHKGLPDGPVYLALGKEAYSMRVTNDEAAAYEEDLFPQHKSITPEPMKHMKLEDQKAETAVETETPPVKPTFSPIARDVIETRESIFNCQRAAEPLTCTKFDVTNGYIDLGGRRVFNGMQDNHVKPGKLFMLGDHILLPNKFTHTVLGAFVEQDVAYIACFPHNLFCDALPLVTEKFWNVTMVHGFEANPFDDKDKDGFMRLKTFKNYKAGVVRAWSSEPFVVAPTGGVTQSSQVEEQPTVVNQYTSQYEIKVSEAVVKQRKIIFEALVVSAANATNVSLRLQSRPNSSSSSSVNSETVHWSASLLKLDGNLFFRGINREMDAGHTVLVMCGDQVKYNDSDKVHTVLGIGRMVDRKYVILNFPEILHSGWLTE